jgi:signal transduction histidine kinase
MGVLVSGMMPSEDRQLLSLIVHELRSPMSVVAGYLRLVLQNPAVQLAEPERKMITEANRSSGRVLQIVRELSELVALETGEGVRPLAPVPVFSVWEESVRAAPPPADVTTFSCAPEDRAIEVPGDARRLKQAFAAVLAASLRERAAGDLASSGFVTGDAGARRVVIALGGSGIEGRGDDVLQKQAPFDWWRGGIGMVLPIARCIIDGHDGRIWSLSAEGPGGCAVSFPIAG